MFLSWIDTSQDVYTEEREVAEFEPKTDETLLVQQKPVSRAKLEARTDSTQVQYNICPLTCWCTAHSASRSVLDDELNQILSVFFFFYLE